MFIRAYIYVPSSIVVRSVLYSVGICIGIGLLRRISRWQQPLRS